MHKITFLELLRTPILLFSATKLKNFFLSEKKLLNAILGAKLKYMKMFSF